MTTQECYNTPAARAALLNPIVKNVAPTFCNLKSRWMDEKDNEDWARYAAVLHQTVSKALPAGSTVARPRKGSFKLRCTIPGFPYQVVLGFVRPASFGWVSK